MFALAWHLSAMRRSKLLIASGNDTSVEYASPPGLIIWAQTTNWLTHATFHIIMMGVIQHGICVNQRQVLETPSPFTTRTCMLVACTDDCMVAVSIYSLHMHAHVMHGRLHHGRYALQFAQWDCIMACMMCSLCKRWRQGMHAQKIWHSKQGKCLCNDIESSQSPRSLEFEFKI